MTLLRERMAEDLRIRNYSPRTVECYVSMMARFTREFGNGIGSGNLHRIIDRGRPNIERPAKNERKIRMRELKCCLGYIQI